MVLRMRFILFIGLFLFLFVNTNAQSKTDSLQADSIKIPVLRHLVLESPLTMPSLIEADTLRLDFYRYNPYTLYTQYPGYLGVIGQASYSLSYFDNTLLSDNPFLKPYVATFFSNRNIALYNSRRPFTILSYTHGAQQEEFFDAFHTQNISKNWNIGFEMRMYGGEGHYNLQKAGTHQMKAFTSYFGQRYSVIGQYAFNRLYTQENGGITDIENLHNKSTNSKSLNTSLLAANSAIKYSQLYIKQEFNLGTAKPETDSATVDLEEFPLSFGHEFSYDKTYRKFDEILYTSSKKHYSNLARDTANSLDTAIMKTFSNFFFLKLTNNKRVGSIIVGGGFENENQISVDYQQLNKDMNFTSSFAKARLWKESAKHQGLSIDAKFYTGGRKQDDYETEIRLFKDFSALDSSRIEARFSANETAPSIFYNNYQSNHYTWNSNLKPQQTLNANLSFASLRNLFSMKASISNIENYVFFNESKDITQSQESILVSAFEITKETNCGILYLSNSIVYQDASSAIYFPEFITNNTVALNMQLFKKHLRMKTGFDIMYYTSFKAQGYEPELGIFYNQYENKCGDYPFVDAFVQMNFKRMQFFMKYSNAAYWLTSSNSFVNVDKYPLPGAQFSYGLSWYFYN